MTRAVSAAPIFFILMPYVGISILPSDIQPIALILAIAALFFSSKKLEIDIIAKLLISIMFISMGSFLFNRYDPNGDILFDSRSLFGYITAPIIYVYFYNYLMSTNRIVLIKIIDYAVILVFFGFFLNLINLTSVIQLFVNRAIFEESVGARGLTSFFPEQSRLPTQAVFFAFFYLISESLNWKRALFLFMMAALSASGQFFINIVVFVIGISGSVLVNSLKNREFRPIHVAYVGFGTALLTAIFFAARDHHLYLIEIGLPARGIQAFHQITTSGIMSFADDLGFLFKVSGPLQGISAIINEPFAIRIGTAYYFPIENDLLRTYSHIIYDTFGSYLVPLPPRSYSIFGAWWSDFRIYGVVLTTIFSIVLARKSATANSSVLVGICTVLIFLFLFRSNTSDPTPWAAAAAISYAGRRISGVPK